jgi:transcriptional regulator with XRE-family HTH domain
MPHVNEPHENFVNESAFQVGWESANLGLTRKTKGGKDMRQSEDGTIGRRIARARHEAGLTQEELAALIGVTTRSVQGYEAGSVTPFRHLRKLEDATEKPRGWLLYGDDDGAAGASVGDVATRLAALVGQIAEDAERIARAAEQLERARTTQPLPPAQPAARKRSRRPLPRASGEPA